MVWLPDGEQIRTYVYSFWHDPWTWKKSPWISRTAAHIFVSPGDAPATITQYVAWMETIQCLPNPSQYVPIYLQEFPSYTMLKSMRKSKNRYFYHIFVSPEDAPGAITLNVVWMKQNSMLTNCLAACTHLTITVSGISRYWSKIVTFSYPSCIRRPR